MSQNRKMPSKREIVKHWNNTYNIDLNDTYCWGCGFTGGLERAHIIPRSYCANDNADNLVLLCKFCHNHIQEPMGITENQGALKFKETILDGSPYMTMRMAYMIEGIKKGIYDNIACALELKEEIKQVKKYLLSI